MAPVKFKSVVSFSSQDPVHCISNLLEPNQWLRWLCAPTDRCGSVQAEFQLESAVKIGFIDIGNYGSALIEIQVRRSSASDDQFRTIVPTTTCMTPMDSKQGKNKTGVKMFTRDQLCEDVRDDYWDRLKVICRQPFKKDSQYGLAFINVRSVDDKMEGRSEKQQTLAHTEIKPQQVPKPSKPRDRGHVLSPSWKSNTAFQKTFAAINKEESAATSNLKDRLVKIEATSELKSQSGHSLGRAAKLMLAASERKGLSSLSPFQPPLNKENTGAASTSSSSTSSTPSASLSSTSLSSPSSYRTHSLSPQTASESQSTKGQRRRKDRKSVLDAPPGEMELQFEEQVREYLAHVGPALKDATLTELRPEFESRMGRKLEKSERATFKRLAIHAVEVLDDPPGTELPDIGLRRTSKKESSWLQAKPSPVIHASPSSISSPGPSNKDNAQKVKGRQLPSWMDSPVPASEGKPCPKCKGMFPARHMNIHILDCNGRNTGSPGNRVSSPGGALKRRADTPVQSGYQGSWVKKHSADADENPANTPGMDDCGIVRDQLPRGRGGRGKRGRGGGRQGNGRGGGREVGDNSSRGRGRGRGKGAASKRGARGRGQTGGDFGGNSGQRGGRGRGQGRGRGRGKKPNADDLPDPWLVDSSDSSDDDRDWNLNSSGQSGTPGGLGLDMSLTFSGAGSAGPSFDLIPCPICMQEFPECNIALHAALCGETGGGGMQGGGFLQDVAPTVWVD